MLGLTYAAGFQSSDSPVEHVNEVGRTISRNQQMIRFMMLTALNKDVHANERSDCFFITIATYGAWLPGDKRGWVEYHNGWQLPDRALELEAAATMDEGAKILSPHQRQLVEFQVREACEYHRWVCHVVNCRTNHMHTVISSGDAAPKKVRADLKAW